jgi:hypothetical protein
MEKVNLRELNDVEVKEEYQVKISNMLQLLKTWVVVTTTTTTSVGVGKVLGSIGKLHPHRA